MRSIQVLGISLTVAALACGGQSTTPTTSTTTSVPDRARPVAARRHAIHSGCADGGGTRPRRDRRTVKQENIVADQAGQAATTDPHLKNAWGLAFNPGGSCLGVRERQRNVAGLRRQRQAAARGDHPAAERGNAAVRADRTGLQPPASSAFMGDLFIFATEDGTIAALAAGERRHGRAARGQLRQHGDLQGRHDRVAADRVRTRPAVRDGLPQRQDRCVRRSLHAGHDAGQLPDPDLPAGFAPFNVRGIGPLLLVSTPSRTKPRGRRQGPGQRLRRRFLGEGLLPAAADLGRPAQFAVGRWLFAPDKDRASVDIAIGNFGDGMINIYNLSLKGLHVDARWEGALGDTSGKPLVIDGLWALDFGSGPAASRRTRSTSPPARTTRRTACSAASPSRVTASSGSETRRSLQGGRVVPSHLGTARQ